MWTFEISRQTTATKELIWKFWSDVNNWNKWDNTVEKYELFGDFMTGAKGEVKPVGAPKYSFRITDCKPFETFTNKSHLPLCRVGFTVNLTETQNGLLITHKVEMRGLLTFLFSKLVGGKMALGIKKGLEDLV